MGIKTYADVLRERAAEHRDLATRRARGEMVASYLPTGFRDWDANGGLKLGCLSLIAGDTGEGKSHVKRALLSSVARSGHKVLVLDFEDPARDTADREFAEATGIAAHVLGAGDYEESVLDRLDAAVEASADWARLVDYRTELLRAGEVLRVLAALGDEDVPRLVIVDYAQAMNADEGKTLERTLADLAWGLSSWAKKHDAAVVVLSQVKSDVGERGQAWFARYQHEGWQKAVMGTRPGPSKADLAWCGALGERAKDLTYIWRPGRWARAFGFKDVRDDRLHLLKAKVSFGKEGVITLAFDGEHSKLSDIPR